jgi:AAA domain, putative AbiEii toxin, Type IV TA system
MGNAERILMAQIAFDTEWPQGPLPVRFQINLEGEYVALVGANNAAKSSILQAIFRKFGNTRNGKNKCETCLILPERIFVHTSTETGGDTLENYNGQLAQTIGNNHANRSYVSLQGPSSSNLPKLLLNHWNLVEQYHRMNSFFRYFGLSEYVLEGAQEIKFDDIAVAVQGSGLRSIFAILAALSDEHIKLLLIDEPEQSLEAGVQKRLRDLFYTVSNEQGKQIIVTTHSHLFLNRRDVGSNYAVSKDNGLVSINRVVSEAELYAITFRMLGNSLEDLFFPNNFLIVEGSTDQIIAEKVMELKEIDKTRIKVASASGVDKIPNILTAIYTNLLPLVIGNSPYKDTVVVLIDKPYDEQANPSYAKIKAAVSDEQLLELTSTSLESYLPETLYIRSGRDKAEIIREIEKEKDYQKRFQLKTENARAIAGFLTRDDFPDIQIIVDAVNRAAGRAH